MERTELNSLTCDELIELMNKHAKLHEKLADIADRYFTDWDVQDFFRNAPNCLDEDSYGRLMIARYHNTNSNYLELISWANELQGEREMFPAEMIPRFDKAEYYIDVMQNDDCGYINMTYKDYAYLEKYVTELVREIIAHVQSYYDDLRTQFCDDFHLADALLSNELLDNYYIEDGKIYMRRNDLLIA